MRTLRNLVIGVVGSAVWPGFLGLAAYAARQAPWPRGVAYPSSAALGMLALAALAANLLRWLLGSKGWAGDVLAMPPDVTRQLRSTALLVVAAMAAILLPAWLLVRVLDSTNQEIQPALHYRVPNLLDLNNQKGEIKTLLSQPDHGQYSVILDAAHPELRPSLAFPVKL